MLPWIKADIIRGSKPFQGMQMAMSSIWLRSKAVSKPVIFTEGKKPKNLRLQRRSSIHGQQIWLLCPPVVHYLENLNCIHSQTPGLKERHYSIQKEQEQLSLATGAFHVDFKAHWFYLTENDIFRPYVDLQSHWGPFTPVAPLSVVTKTLEMVLLSPWSAGSTGCWSIAVCMWCCFTLLVYLI